MSIGAGSSPLIAEACHRRRDVPTIQHSRVGLIASFVPQPGTDTKQLLMQPESAWTAKRLHQPGGARTQS
jgi:hypothetical protein